MPVAPFQVSLTGCFTPWEHRSFLGALGEGVGMVICQYWGASHCPLLGASWWVPSAQRLIQDIAPALWASGPLALFTLLLLSWPTSVWVSLWFSAVVRSGRNT